MPEGWNKTLLKITEEGATFKSYIDGKIHTLTPETSIQTQRQLGADLIVVLDECTPFHVDKEYTAESMRRSHRWAVRSIKEYLQSHHLSHTRQAIYGIIQGGVYPDLRQESTQFIASLPVFGIAIGGSLGSDREMMKEIIELTCKEIYSPNHSQTDVGSSTTDTIAPSIAPSHRPIHLLGIGGIGDIFHGVRQGIDTFDCVHPSRLGRHGGALVKADYWESDLLTLEDEIKAKENELQEFREKIPDYIKKRMKHVFPAQSSPLKDENENLDIPSHILQKERKFYHTQHIALLDELKRLRSLRNRKIRPHISLLNSSFRNDPRPIDPGCSCSTCRQYSRAYLHHLFKADEMIGPSLVTAHNVWYMNEMMKKIRKGIAEDRLDEVESEYVHPSLR
jgi:queuine/archaeosine tRNA-ribosyltransferase